MAVRIVTISAAFGAAGGLVGPAVAERLRLPFVDRAIPEVVASEIGCTLEEARTHDGRAESGLGRILAGAARLPVVALGGMDVIPNRDLVPPEEFKARTEDVIRRAADTGCVVLGRAGALVLADRPDALHVRLDGPRERRMVRAAAEMPPNRDASAPSGTLYRDVERMLVDNDRARTAYVKHFYGADPADPRLYHLVIDTTRLPVPAAVDLVVAAAGTI
ncbi:AAA family ATPase [Actinomadura sp. WMMB 499]|uniref:cytidylate kinase-like family protein n=1 Tax=Actinomadura sp. WMMB 499 TaxID=1219491 RepID=UPI00124677B5|nr:cytidylate kinase-like family protein [Actinomadura sp. WMMB 499]QFG24311.1 cytidylate kinase-like family protein [Actinomadura sp. WMMB 499]